VANTRVMTPGPVQVNPWSDPGERTPTLQNTTLTQTEPTTGSVRLFMGCFQNERSFRLLLRSSLNDRFRSFRFGPRRARKSHLIL